MGDAVRSIGGYEILEKMGAGTVGTVYRARQVAMDRLVALKILNAKYAVDPSFVEAFIAEARTAGRINHPNVCQVYDVGCEGGVYFFSMELVDGPTLDQVLKERGRLPAAEAMRMVRGVASALSAAHAHGLVHRDVKPGNVVVASSGEPKLVDLGVAKDVTVPGADASSGLVGTPYYMPPEQAQGKPVDIRSDIYALGATFFHLLIGRPPFQGPHPTAVIVKHASEPLTSPSQLDPKIPREVSAIVEKMMAKRPADRYADPRALIAELDRAEVGGAAEAKLALAPAPAAAPAPTHRRAARRRVTVRAPGGKSVGVPVAVGGGALLLIGVLAMLLSGGRDPDVVRAERELSRASELLGSDAPGATDEAARIARDVLRTLPSTSDLRPQAERIVGRAEEKKVVLELRRMDEIVLAVADGGRAPEDAKASIEDLRRLWEASGMPDAGKARVVEHARFALEKIDALAGGRARPAEPELGALAKETLERTGKALEAGSFAEAMDIVAEAVGRTEGHDRSALEAAMSDIRKRAEKDFSGLMRDVQGKLDAGGFVQAELDLNSARPRFAFGPYPGQIDARIAEVREAAAAGIAAKPGPAETTEVASAESDAEAGPEPEAPEEPEQPPEDEVAAAEDPDAQAAADEAAQMAATEFFEKEGWDAEGGTWTLKKNVLKVTVPDGSRARLVYAKTRRASDLRTQFDARILAGSGFRLQWRWTDSAPANVPIPGVDPGRGYALFVGTGEVLLQMRGLGANVRGWRRQLRQFAIDYETWTRKIIRGGRWNRFVVQASGTRLVAVVSGAGQLTRIDETYQSGMIRFEFSGGSKVELRKLAIRAQ